MKPTRDDRVTNAVMATGRRYIIVAPPCVGKSFAAVAMPDVIADIDLFLMRRTPDSPLPPAPWTRVPDFPVNFVKEVVAKLKTHPIVLLPMKANRDLAVWLVNLVRSERALETPGISSGSWNLDQVKSYVRWATEYPTLASDDDVERLTKDLIPVLDELRSIEFQAVAAVPDPECLDQILEHKIERDKQMRETGVLVGEEFKGIEHEAQSFAENNALFEQAIATGRFVKMPIRRGQYFLDALGEFLGGQT